MLIMALFYRQFIEKDVQSISSLGQICWVGSWLLCKVNGFHIREYITATRRWDCLHEGLTFADKNLAYGIQCSENISYQTWVTRQHKLSSIEVDTC